MRASRFAAFLFLASVAAAGCNRPLSGPQIRRLLSDSHVTGQHLFEGYHFERTYHADGKFEQTKGPAGKGTWFVDDGDICITWYPPYHKSGRSFCRRLETDDQGHYWKEFDRHGHTVKVVRYDSIVGFDGHDRRHIRPTSARVLRVVTNPVLLLGFGLVALFLLSKLLTGKNKPRSLRNRLRRRLFKLKAGSYSYPYRTLKQLAQPQLLEFLVACLRDNKPVEVIWTVELVFASVTDKRHTVAALWHCLEPLDDDAAQRGLAAALPYLDDPPATEKAIDGDMRCAYLLGKAYADRASVYQTSNEANFDQTKKVALQYWDHVRSKQKSPPPELAARGAPYRQNAIPSKAQPDYATLVGPAYESLMYMKYAPPAVHHHHGGGSSYMGGG